MKLREIKGFLGFFWSLTRGRVVLGMVFALLVGLTEGVSLLLLVPLIAAASPGNEASLAKLPVIGEWLATLQPDLGLLLVGFVVLIALQAMLNRSKTLYNQRVMHKASDRLRLTLFSDVAMARWRAISARRISDINYQLTNEVDRLIRAAASVINFIQSAILLIVYLILAAAVSWQMALFAVAVGIVFFAGLYPIRRRATRHGKALSGMFQEQNNAVMEFISGVRLAKLFLAEQRQLNSYASHLTRMRAAITSFIGSSSLGSLLFQTGAAVVAALFVWVSIRVYQLEVARLAVLLLIFARIAPRFGMMQENAQAFLGDAPAYLNYQSSRNYFYHNAEPLPDPSAKPLHLRQSIRLEGLGVQFPGAAQAALHDIDLTIAAGRITAIIGASGSGKSTLADLLLGLTEPDSGRIMIDDEPLTLNNRRAWRARVASVPQDAFLLNDTVAANLRLGRPDAEEAALWQALERANIASLIRSLPDGLNTMAGERGGRFSGGERQRLALARALLREPELLVLDEATSALDWENQQSIATAIESMRGQLTIVTIAHRPSLINFADDVIALESGRLVEQGTYADLAAREDSALAKVLAGDRAD